MEPNENRHEQSTEYDYVGEITHGSTNYTFDFMSMVGEWFNEGANYDFSQGACLDEDGEAQEDDDECTRYIQVN